MGGGGPLALRRASSAGVVGEQIALDTANSPPMWFEGHVDAPERTAERFTPDRRWYLTGAPAGSTTTASAPSPPATTT